MSVLSMPVLPTGNYGIQTKNIIVPAISAAPDNIRYAERTPFQVTSYRWSYSIIDTIAELITSGEIQAITKSNNTLLYSQFGITGDRINYMIAPVIDASNLCIRITNLSNNPLKVNLRRLQT
jgi:hypothetical protein